MATEKRLIDANALMDAIWNIEVIDYAKTSVEFIQEFDRLLYSLRGLIATAPIVDAVEVVHGRCKKSENREEWYAHEYTCLECGATMMVSDVDNYDIAPNYCANCGAKMDGGEDNG